MQTRSQKIGYKKLRNDYIAKLRILGQTNENREGIVDAQYAKYRTSKVQVLKIYHYDTHHEVQEMNGIFDKKFMYRRGEIIEIDNYDTLTTNICGRGIHYFKTEYQAMVWGLCPKQYKFNGVYKMWWSNGQLRSIHTFVKGQKHGTFVKYTNDGKIISEGQFNKDNLHGLVKEWFSEKNMCEYTYDKGTIKEVHWHLTEN